jgi:cardiolipin synthase
VRGTANIQCLASGPSVKNSAIEEVLIMAIYSAQKKLVLTTPYFIPNESMFYALIASARRGVEVTLIVPAKVDSRLAHYASRAFLQDLVEAGVRVAFYEGGMLHTKSITVDGEFCLFGSLNLDPRSLRINFEITLAIYGGTFVRALSDLQDLYLTKSKFLDLSTYVKQGWRTRLLEDVARLAGPIL